MKTDNYIIDKSIEAILKYYRSFGKGQDRDYVAGNFFNINFDIKRDFREHGKIYITDEMLTEVTKFKQATFVLIFFILKKLMKSDNRIYLTASVFTNETGLSDASFYRALRELKENEWIIETRPKHFNVNVNKLFKGSVDSLLRKYQVQEKRKILNMEERAKKLNDQKELNKIKNI